MQDTTDQFSHFLSIPDRVMLGYLKHFGIVVEQCSAEAWLECLLEIEDTIRSTPKHGETYLRLMRTKDNYQAAMVIAEKLEHAIAQSSLKAVAPAITLTSTCDRDYHTVAKQALTHREQLDVRLLQSVGIQIAHCPSNEWVKLAIESKCMAHDCGPFDVAYSHFVDRAINYEKAAIYMNKIENFVPKVEKDISDEPTCKA